MRVYDVVCSGVVSWRVGVGAAIHGAVVSSRVGLGHVGARSAGVRVRYTGGSGRPEGWADCLT